MPPQRRRRVADGAGRGAAVPTDVSRIEDVQALKDTVYARFGEVGDADEQRRHRPGGGPWENIDRWRRVMEVNLWGVINGVQTFAPPMIAQKTARHRQYRLETGHHQPAGRHRLQRQQGRREGADRGARP